MSNQLRVTSSTDGDEDQCSVHLLDDQAEVRDRKVITKC
jgi:hypothetical protein